MEAETCFDLELETEALIARGMDPSAAYDTARRHFGSVALVKDDCREVWGIRALDSLAQDLRCTLSHLRKCPGYTSAAPASSCSRSRSAST